MSENKRSVNHAERMMLRFRERTSRTSSIKEKPKEQKKIMNGDGIGVFLVFVKMNWLQVQFILL